MTSFSSTAMPCHSRKLQLDNATERANARYQLKEYLALLLLDVLQLPLDLEIYGHQLPTVTCFLVVWAIHQTLALIMEEEISKQLSRLEMLYTEQEYTIQTLNQVTSQQDQEITRLRSDLELLKQQYLELKSDLPLPAGGDEKPPHYWFTSLKMIFETSTVSSYFRNYSGLLYQQLEFELLNDGLIIKLQQQPDNIRYKHSYNEPSFFKRAQQSNQALLKACNNKPRNIKTLLDLTGGWGMDSFILACHGHSVTCIEQNELVHQVSAYSLNCAKEIKSSARAANRITLIQSDSTEYLQNHGDSGNFDCIYLDPMFPEHKSSAKSAKSLQILQKLTHNQDIEMCFELALQKARKRVVVKRPAKSAPISDLGPDLVYREKTIRFDVYLTG